MNDPLHRHQKFTLTVKISDLHLFFRFFCSELSSLVFPFCHHLWHRKTLVCRVSCSFLHDICHLFFNLVFFFFAFFVTQIHRINSCWFPNIVVVNFGKPILAKTKCSQTMFGQINHFGGERKSSKHSNTNSGDSYTH